MKRPWSIATAVRNPERLHDFLLVLKQMEGLPWNHENQKKYQVLLIQNRKYGYGTPQFYKGLSPAQVELISDSSKDISFKKAEEIFNAKNYEDPAMRGRHSINPLKKMGFVAINNEVIKITDFGKLFLSSQSDFDEIFLRSFLKWQIPDSDNRGNSRDMEQDIKPFVGVLHLINEVNQKEIALDNRPKGISKKEFTLFAPTLINSRDVKTYADKIIALRTEMQNSDPENRESVFDAYARQFAATFLSTSTKEEITKLLKNLKDYGDNAIRYFRLTRYIYIRGNGFYVDLEPRRSVEIDSLLAHDNGRAISFKEAKTYHAYLSDISKPQLPWETSAKFIEIIKKLVDEIQQYETSLNKSKGAVLEYHTMDIAALRKYAAKLRVYRQQLQAEENQKQSQSLQQVAHYITTLGDIHSLDNKPIMLEKFSTLGLYALDDALKIQPNYPVGDDNEPTFTAPANVPDIECFYQNFNAICEVTMLTNRSQWYNEGQPVMRHLRDFENKNNEKPAYCLFIAPKLHRDTVNTFWMATKYEYEGKAQKIVPLSIKQFISVLEVLPLIKKATRSLTHVEILKLYDEIVNSVANFNDSNDWLESIPSTIASWRESVTPAT